MSDTATRMATCPRCGLFGYFEGDSRICTECVMSGESLLAEADNVLAEWDPADEDPGMEGLVNAAKLTPSLIEWLWPGYLPFDTLTIIDGDSTVGKSLTMVDLIARMSRDDFMPDGTPPAKTAVIILNKEDHWTRVTVPNLLAAGADLSSGRIFFLEGKRRLLCPRCRRRDCRNPEHDAPLEAGWDSVVLPADTDYLESKIKAVKMASGLDRVLFYADPLMAVIEDEINTHNYHEMIRALEPIHRLCGDTRSAFVGIRHFTKTNVSGKAIHQGQGSTAIFSTSRMGLMVAYDPYDDNEDENQRVRIVAVTGTNLGRKMGSLRWQIEETNVLVENKTTALMVPTVRPKIRWLGESPVSADEIAQATTGERGPGATVKLKLRAALRDGPVMHGKIWELLESDTNASERTRWRVINQEVETGRMLKSRESREHGKVWYALPKHAEELETIVGQEGE